MSLGFYVIGVILYFKKTSRALGYFWNTVLCFKSHGNVCKSGTFSLLMLAVLWAPIFHLQHQLSQSLQIVMSFGN